MGDGDDVQLMLGGEAFVDVSEDVATAHCEAEQAAVQTELDALDERVGAMEARQKELKGVLYGRFGFDRETEDGTQISFRIDTEEKVIGWFRHAEPKHGRVAMAAFLGFTAQCTPLVSGEHNIAPYRGYVAGCTPQEQWDNIPLYGKLQILVLIGMLESYGEGAGSPEGYVHYTKGGKPGYYPPIKGKGFGQITFNLWEASTSTA